MSNKDTIEFSGWTESDSVIFSELIADNVGETIAIAIGKFRIEEVVNQGVENLKTIVAEAVSNAVRNDQFAKEFVHAVMKKEIDRKIQILKQRSIHD